MTWQITIAALLVILLIFAGLGLFGSLGRSRRRYTSGELFGTSFGGGGFGGQGAAFGAGTKRSGW